MTEQVLNGEKSTYSRISSVLVGITRDRPDDEERGRVTVTAVLSEELGDGAE
ncbi:MAG TPA: hypothetical protein VFF32_11125 [Dermatophilaceae bacterium]|nr:hypothetical protein [Dermatophilaceae bacterium]